MGGILSWLNFKNLPPRMLKIHGVDSEFDFTPEEWGQIAFMMLAVSRTAFRSVEHLCAQNSEFNAAYLSSSVSEREALHLLVRDTLFYKEFVPTYELSLLKDNLLNGDTKRALHWLRSIVEQSEGIQSSPEDALTAAYHGLTGERISPGFSKHEPWTAEPSERKNLFAVNFLRDMKKLLLLYGTKRTLGYADQDRTLVDLRAVYRLEKATPAREEPWKRGESMRIDSPMDAEDAEDAKSPDPVEFEIAMSAAEIGSDTVLLVDMAEALSEFEREKATEGEKALLDALWREESPRDALAAVGDPENWSRWQSLQRKAQRYLKNRKIS